MGEHAWQIVSGVALLIAGMVLNQARKDLWPKGAKITWRGVVIAIAVAVAIPSLYSLIRVAAGDEPLTAALSKMFLALMGCIILTTAGWGLTVVNLNRRVSAIERHLIASNRQ